MYSHCRPFILLFGVCTMQCILLILTAVNNVTVNVAH